LVELGGKSILLQALVECLISLTHGSDLAAESVCVVFPSGPAVVVNLHAEEKVRERCLVSANVISETSSMKAREEDPAAAPSNTLSGRPTSAIRKEGQGSRCQSETDLKHHSIPPTGSRRGRSQTPKEESEEIDLLVQR